MAVSFILILMLTTLGQVTLIWTPPGMVAFVSSEATSPAFKKPVVPNDPEPVVPVAPVSPLIDRLRLPPAPAPELNPNR